MSDVVFVLIPVGVFSLCVAFVHVCDRIVGPDPVPASVDPEGARAVQEVPS